MPELVKTVVTDRYHDVASIQTMLSTLFPGGGWNVEVSPHLPSYKKTLEKLIHKLEALHGYPGVHSDASRARPNKQGFVFLNFFGAHVAHDYVQAILRRHKPR